MRRGHALRELRGFTLTLGGEVLVSMRKGWEIPLKVGRVETLRVGRGDKRESWEGRHTKREEGRYTRELIGFRH